jgi:hypothetical protein
MFHVVFEFSSKKMAKIWFEVSSRILIAWPTQTQQGLQTFRSRRNAIQWRSWQSDEQRDTTAKCGDYHSSARVQLKLTSPLFSFFKFWSMRLGCRCNVTCSPVINLTVLKDGLLWLDLSNQVNKSIQIGGVFLAGFQTAQAYW